MQVLGFHFVKNAKNKEILHVTGSNPVQYVRTATSMIFIDLIKIINLMLLFINSELNMIYKWFIRSDKCQEDYLDMI